MQQQVIRQTIAENEKASFSMATLSAYTADQISRERISGFVTTGRGFLKYITLFDKSKSKKLILQAKI